jgi:hypothetical protein
MGVTGWWAETLSEASTFTLRSVTTMLSGPVDAIVSRTRSLQAYLSGQQTLTGAVDVDIRAPQALLQSGFYGSAAPTLRRPTAALTGNLGLSGTMGAALQKPTMSATGVGGISQFTGVTYSITGTVYSTNNPPTYTYMNNNSANGSAQNAETGTENDGGIVKADCGSTRFIDHIVIGYDYLDNFPTGWGVEFTEGLLIEGSTDNTNWTSEGVTPTYASSGSSNGLVSIPIGGNYRYIRLREDTGYYMCVLEFQLWGA